MSTQSTFAAFAANLQLWKVFWISINTIKLLAISLFASSDVLFPLEAADVCFKSAVMHDLRLIHTDLKPENILLVSAESIRVPDYKVIT